MRSNNPVLISGAYRSGTTFANAAMSCFEGYSSLSSGLKFMRFCYGEYGDKLETESQLKALLEDCHLRLRNRWGIQIPVEEIFNQATETGISYSTAYDLLIRDILDIREQGLAFQWCDKLVLGWDLAEKYLELFPGGVVVHVIRNPLDVLKSYERMTSESNPVYLDAIFNCYSSFVFAEKAAKKQNDRLIVCKSEELADPYSEVYERLSNLLERKFDRNKFSSGNFHTLIDQWSINSTRHKSISVNSLRSSQNNESLFTDLESHLLEYLCGKYMDEYAFSRDYQSVNISQNEVEKRLGFDYLIKRYRLAIDGKDPGPSYYTNPVNFEWSIVNEEQAKTEQPR
jgi:hypothetical protein